MKTILIIVGVMVVLLVLTLVELLISAWKENDELSKEIDRLKRQGITPRKFEKTDS